MSAMALLLGLLVVAFVGSQLMGGRGRTFGLVSGAEYLVLGVALGPYALGAVERSTLHAFQPIVMVCTAWLTLVIGVDFGVQNQRAVTFRGVVVGVLLAAVSAVAAGAATHQIATRLGAWRPDEALLAALGVGIVACETTRHATRWVTQRYLAGGPLSRLVADVAEADDLVPIAGIALLFPLLAPVELSFPLSPWVLAAGTPLLGAVLGGTAAALLRGEPRASDGWGVVLGAVLLATGLASWLGLSPQAATFALGVTLTASSRHRSELRTMIARSERGLLLPTLLLAGADVEVHGVRVTVALVGAVLAVRLVARLLFAPLLTTLAGAGTRAAPALSLGLMPSGALSIALGLAWAGRFPGVAGDTVLAVAVLLAVLGELVGPAGLRRALTRVGEIPEPAGAAASAVPVGPAEPAERAS